MAEPAPSIQMNQTRTSKTDYIIKLWTHLQSRISNIMKDETTFEQLTRFMGDKNNIKLTSSFCTMLSSFCNKEPLNKESLKKESENTKKARLILSSLMITKFPLDVLDVADIKDLDPSSEACYQSALKMINCIIKTDINDSSNVGKLKYDDLLKCINQFIHNFDLWKNKDLEKVLDSVVNYYEQWMRSYKILSKSSMNEAQKKIILNTLVSNMNKTQTRIAKLVGADKAKTICQGIKDKVNAEPDPEPEPKHQHANINQPNSDQKENNDEPEEALTLEQKLAKKGVPMNIKSGRNLVHEMPKDTNNNQEAQDPNEKYTKMVNGQKMLDLDMIIMEEASKRYWNDFEKQITSGDYSRLFELLSELLERLKKLSPENQHKHLDDLMDVSFIQQTIENGMIDAKGFYAIYFGIWSQIKTLHAPNEDKEWQAWHDYILGQFGSENATWGTLLAQVFNVFLRKMDKIEDQIKVIQHVKQQRKKD